MSERPTPETDALAEKLIPIAGGITAFNAQSIIKQLLTEILTKTTKLERERDDAREEWGKASMDAAQLLSEKTKVMAERDEAREALMEIEDRCVDCEDACGDIQKIRDIAVKALEEPK